MAGDDLPNGLLPSNKGFRGTATPDRRHRENPDEVSAVTTCHADRVGSARFAGRRGVYKHRELLNAIEIPSRATTRSDRGLATIGVEIRLVMSV